MLSTFLKENKIKHNIHNKQQNRKKKTGTASEEKGGSGDTILNIRRLM